jgi:TetR/AcrR family transcriptional regulator, cholesterol catabolism regulator
VRIFLEIFIYPLTLIPQPAKLANKCSVGGKSMAVKAISERKEQILDAAERLFNERGYLATSVRDLADALGMEAASLYSHYKSKEDILWTIADRCADEFFMTIKPIAASPLHTRKKLTDMIVAHVGVITHNINASAVFFREWRHISEPRRSEYALLRNDYEGIFRKVVRQGIEENLFKNYDEGFSTRTIMSAINWTHTWYRPDGEMTSEEIGEHLAGILLNGLVRTV